MFIDSHAHLDYYDNHEDFLIYISNAIDKNISSILTINTSINKFNKLYDLIRDYNSLWCSVGEHPCNINESNIPSINQLLEFSKKEKVVGIGETGLDFYYSNKNKKFQYKSLQNHIEASYLSNLPLIIHMRNSDNELINHLSNENKKNSFNAVMHCFTSSRNLLYKCLDNGFYISISGIITFKNSNNLQELIKDIPMEKLLIETDSPFLTPVPLRGKINQPCNVYYIALFISSLLGINSNKLAKCTSDNFYRLFSKATKYNRIYNES